MNCLQCGLKISPHPLSTPSAGTCPHCGHPLESRSTATHPLAGYLDDLKAVLLQPKSFFSRMPRNAGLGQPLAFALIAHWLGSAIAFLWSTASAPNRTRFFEKWFEAFHSNDSIDVIRRNSSMAHFHLAGQSFVSWLWGVGTVITDPFSTLIWLLVNSFFVFLGARLFVGVMSDTPTLNGSRHEVTYESAIRIISYGSVASIFLILPWFGGAIAALYGLYISVMGAKEVYRVGTGRALAIICFPTLLVIGIVFALISLMALLAFKLMGSYFL